MTILRFTDGDEYHVGGPLRAEHRNADESTLRRYYQAWNEQDFIAAEDLIGSDVIDSIEGGSKSQPWVLLKYSGARTIHGRCVKNQ